MGHADDDGDGGQIKGFRAQPLGKPARMGIISKLGLSLSDLSNSNPRKRKILWRWLMRSLCVLYGNLNLIDTNMFICLWR